MKISFWALIMSCLFFLSGFQIAAAESMVAVQAVGVESNESQAVESAKRQAVEKILARFLAPSKDPNSDFQKISARYREFVNGFEISKKQKANGKLSIYSKVQVDAEKIQSTIQSLGKSAQESNEDLEACFLIRVVGSNDNARVYRACNDSFQRMGFRVVNSDEVLTQIDGDSSSEKFFDRLTQLVYQDFPEITMAVIGEIEVEKSGEDGANSIVHLRAIDMLSRRVIADFQETYRARGSNSDESIMLVLDKSAKNSSETLADKSINYFRKGGAR